MTTKQTAIIQAWNDFEDAEPDISTERLMEMVCQYCKVDAGEVCEALIAQNKVNGDL